MEKTTSKRKNIYMGAELEALASDLKGGRFSRRLNEIVRNYQAIMANTPIPDFNNDIKTAQLKLLLDILQHGNISPEFFDSLPDTIIKSEALDESELKDLADKVRNTPVAELVKLIDPM